MTDDPHSHTGKYDLRKAKYSNIKMQHPAWNIGLLISVLGLFGTGLGVTNAIENQVEANKLGLDYEVKMRVSEKENLKEDIEELKQDVKDIKKEIRESNDEVKDLLQKMLAEQRS